MLSAGGEVTCNDVSCYIRDDCKPRYVKGVCCPQFDNCPPIGNKFVIHLAHLKCVIVPEIISDAISKSVMISLLSVLRKSIKSEKSLISVLKDEFVILIISTLLLHFQTMLKSPPRRIQTQNRPRTM